MNILITGGLGYIGSHTVVELIESGITPVIMNNLSNLYLEVKNLLKEIIGFEPIVYQIDCRDKLSFANVFIEHNDIKGVIHFAAFKVVGESVDNQIKYYQNNLEKK